MMSRHLPFCYLAAVSLVAKSITITALARPSSTRAVASSSSSSASSSSLRAAPLEDFGELPPDFPRRGDVLVALSAVRKAAAMTNRLQPLNANGIASVNKLDASPVTVADLAAQAIVLHHVKHHFPRDSFIAEESSQVLKDEDLLARVMAATNMDSTDLVKQSIDLGKEYELWNDDDDADDDADNTAIDRRGRRPPRVWCLDPIDGTKGFLRGRRDGGQYCIALALLEDGIPTVGIMGCPNLPSNPLDFNYAWTNDERENNSDDDDDANTKHSSTRGCIFVASKGGGAYQLPLLPNLDTPSLPVKLHVTPSDATTPMEARFCLGVEKFSDALGQCAGMAKILHGPDGVTADGDIVNARRFDSMAKYGVMARAGAELYARLPKPGYQEWIWDHAAGLVVLTEAGGTMTDTNGDAIDFSLGAKMSPNVKGVLASNGGAIHQALVKAFQQQEVERLEQSPNVPQ
jgi:3'(2'), 5'-bisphosphate nucleotidase